MVTNFFLGNRQSCLRSQFATASKRNIRHLPVAFTEHGALMAANILNSHRAVAMRVYVILKEDAVRYRVRKKN